MFSITNPGTFSSSPNSNPLEKKKPLKGNPKRGEATARAFGDLSSTPQAASHPRLKAKPGSKTSGKAIKVLQKAGLVPLPPKEELFQAKTQATLSSALASARATLASLLQALLKRVTSPTSDDPLLKGFTNLVKTYDKAQQAGGNPLDELEGDLQGLTNSMSSEQLDQCANTLQTFFHSKPPFKFNQKQREAFNSVKEKVENLLIVPRLANQWGGVLHRLSQSNPKLSEFADQIRPIIEGYSRMSPPQRKRVQEAIQESLKGIDSSDRTLFLSFFNSKKVKETVLGESLHPSGSPQSLAYDELKGSILKFLLPD